MNTSINLEIQLTPEAPRALMEIDGYFVIVTPLLIHYFEVIYLLLKVGAKITIDPVSSRDRVTFRKSMFEWELRLVLHLS